MAFPRSFTNETWFMRLPTGEIELTQDGALERAFRCGLVDARTPVRAVTSTVWTTLGDAAQLPGDSLASASASPAAPAQDLDDGRRWHVRHDGPEPRFDTLRKRSLASAALALLIGVGLTTLGLDVAHAEEAEAAARLASSAEAAVIDPRLVRAMRDARESVEQPHVSPREIVRQMKEQQQKLHELDLQRRLRGDARQCSQCQISEGTVRRKP